MSKQKEILSQQTEKKKTYHPNIPVGVIALKYKKNTRILFYKYSPPNDK